MRSFRLLRFLGLALTAILARDLQAQQIPGELVVLRGSGTRDVWATNLTGSPQWRMQTPVPAPVGSGGALAQLWRFAWLYALRGDGTTDFWRASVNGGAWVWSAMAPFPGPVGAGASLIGTNTGPWDFVYALQGGGSRALYRYDGVNNTWAHVSDTPGPVAAGGAIAQSSWGQQPILTVVLGGGSSQVWQYRTANDTWVAIADLGAPSGDGTAITHLHSSCYYAVGGNATARYLAFPDPGGPQWCPESGLLASLPAAAGAGASVSAATRYDGVPDDYVFAIRGAATRDVWSWKRSPNTWHVLPSLPHSVVAGGAVLYVPYTAAGPVPVQTPAFSDVKRVYR